MKCLYFLFEAFERLENKYNYLDNYVIPVVADWSGQVNIRRAITLRINKGDEFGISKQVLSLIPIIGPLHISLNNRETLFQTYYFFFEELYHHLFGEKKILSHKPKQTVINLILDLTFNGWKKIRNIIMNRFENSKDIEYRMIIDLLDNSIPHTLDIYTTLFRSIYFEGYLEGVARIWILFQRLRRHNYNKASLVFLTLQIIQNAKIIDVERNSNLSFKEAFVNTRNPAISQVKLNYLEKKVSLFLFSLFDEIFYNLENTNQIDNNKYPSFALLSFKTNIDVNVFPLAWSTKNKPFKNKFCDAENCLLPNNIELSNNSIIILICGYGFHKECLNSCNGNCSHCFNYLSLEIKKNANSLTERLNIPLKDNEKPLVEKSVYDNNTNENIDKNIQEIIENLEQNIDNQFENLYQKWSNYNSL
ncbi:hypothetical protein GLOIN_2v1846234 [Rhizophagus clarus]|uniref:Uncharacterized protein n=1 Tax=Rhizophagus clarus TaxID=94130 RepID=A0A8H3QFF6_9GLOM|nr:hypothetical protein GLOIN_2v1846234 [Rhizophagus clarus]